jgi:hypothetical protein
MIKLLNRLIIFLVLILIIAAIVFFIVRPDFTHTSDSSASQISSSIVKEVLPVSKFVSLEHSYQTTGEYNKRDSDVYFNILKIERTNKLVYSFFAVLKLGVDGSKISVQTDENNINIFMPKIEMISNDIDLSSIKFLADEKSFFAKPLSRQQANMILDDKLREVSAKIMKDPQIIEQAQKSAEESILNLLQAIPQIHDYNVHFFWVDEDTSTFKTQMVGPRG